ncbi:MAG: type II 3-dehydroquinate dehydratase [Candidatus Eremiobacteraeota bacterium]|nr:type II 3-dehydroquinate dehydratase [Candidatus Eremiobacteraeota bacterium]
MIPPALWHIAVVNGPNLNLLGTREPALYGRETLVDVERRMRALGAELGVELSFAQRNGEGELIDLVHGYARTADGAIINAGAYTHTSLALRDALVGVGVPFVEVHVTNVYAREPERYRSTLAAAAAGTVGGFGTVGYELALRGIVAVLDRRRADGADPLPAAAA